MNRSVAQVLPQLQPSHIQERVTERGRADLSLLWEESFGDVLSAFGGFRAVERPAGASEMGEYGGELGCSSVTLASCPPDEFVRAVVVEV